MDPVSTRSETLSTAVNPLKRFVSPEVSKTASRTILIPVGPDLREGLHRSQGEATAIAATLGLRELE
jgi:hypothetical protein